MKTTKKEQWNTRVRPQYKNAARICAALLDISQDEIAELALRSLLGVNDDPTAERRKRVTEAWRKIGEPLPFEYPTQQVASAVTI